MNMGSSRITVFSDSHSNFISHEDALKTATAILSDAGLSDLEKEPIDETDPDKSANLKCEYNGQTQHSSEAKHQEEILALLKHMVGPDAFLKAENNFANTTLFAAEAAIFGFLMIAIQRKITLADQILFELCLSFTFAIFFCALLMLALIYERPNVECFTKLLKILHGIILVLIAVTGFLVFSFIVRAIHKKSDG